MPINAQVAKQRWRRYMSTAAITATTVPSQADKCDNFFLGQQWEEKTSML